MGVTLDLLKLLSDAQVKFVLVGGLAAFLQGSPHITEDVDVCAPLDQPNLERIISALKAVHPKFRFHPKQFPLPDEALKLAGFRNLNLGTDLGKIDILDEISGVGGYNQVLRSSEKMDLGGFTIDVLDIDGLIAAKKAAGRLKDRLILPSLEALRETRRKDRPAP